MPLTKQYLKYNPSGVFGIVASRTCNAVFLKPSKFVASGAVDGVNLWDTRFQRRLHRLNSESTVVFLRPNKDASLLAVGHVNGAVSLYDISDKSEDAYLEAKITFEGHRSEITSLCWDDDGGTMLASGSKDTKVIIWDCVSENGLAKLKLHKGPITKVQFWRNASYVLSSSEDSTLRIWSMITYECIHTIAGDSKIWDFCAWSSIGDYIIIAETNIRLFQIQNDNTTSSDAFTSVVLGSILRDTKDRRTARLQLIDNRFLIAVGSDSPKVDIFRLNSAEEIQKRVKKRVKKHGDQANRDITVTDLVVREPSLKATEGKLKSIDVIRENNFLKILCGLASNKMELLTFEPSEIRTIEATKKPVLLAFDGHSEIISAVAFSSDKRAILTASTDSFKIWNRETLNCILTIVNGDPVNCCKFCLGDRYFIAGTKNGKILFGDISTSRLRRMVGERDEQSVKSHDCISTYPNGRGFAISEQNEVQFYEFVQSEGKIEFMLKRRHDLGDTVTCLGISLQMRYIIIGLLDSTIKIFYFDTLKLHHSLYGHNLPPKGLDISSDLKYLISCAGDKTIRLWGVQFGDCLSTMMHSDGFVDCSFIENSHHYVAVASNAVNFYDGDHHERIQTIKGLSGRSTCMAVSGLHVVSAGTDQAVRVFSRGDEILVLSDEREMEREEQFAKESVKEKQEVTALITAETEKWTDKLIEALDIFTAKPTTSPDILAYAAKDYKEYIYKVFASIKATEMEQSLTLLPNSYVHEMIRAIIVILKEYPLGTELAIKLLQGIMKFHLQTLLSINKEELNEVNELASTRLKELKDIVGFNSAALSNIHEKRLESEQIQIYRELIGERKKKKRRKERGLKRALIQLA